MALGKMNGMSAFLRGFLFGILMVLPTLGFCQFTDDFSDGDFTANPTWTGDAANFEVDGNQKLHLNAPAESDTSYLSVTSEAIDDAT
ncbi:MAG: hypothetical protein KDB98_02975 [Flavobacteriales bacterium]|nr:hypothetical protein [Flavobacteriales bacterium]